MKFYYASRVEEVLEIALEKKIDEEFVRNEIDNNSNVDQIFRAKL